MLKHLSINNYALIRELEMDFQQGFSVMTGETGSGKSIILGALALVMGQRADSKVITDGEQKCVIEAEFLLKRDELKEFFLKNDLDYEEGHCWIRRELNRSGKSRSFINDTPTSLTCLKELTDYLIDIHSQHENLLLKSNQFQLETVDTIAANQAERSRYAEAFGVYVDVKQYLEYLMEDAKRSKEDEDYIRFQYKQLEEANLRVGELDELENELEILQHAEVIKTHLAQTYNYLDGDQGVLEQLHDAHYALNKVTTYLAQAETLAERMQSALIELKDISAEVEDLMEQMDFQPQRLQEVEERLDLLNTLMQKHACRTDEELIRLKQSFAERLERIDNSEERIAEAQKALERATMEVQRAGSELTESRKKVKIPTEERLIAQLKRLGIPHPNFQIQYTRSVAPTKNGLDEVQFLFAANKNQTLRNVAEVASGGEVARLMLCLKALLAEHRSLPTLIFDEIDTGVSGEVATQMAEIMRGMAHYMQVMAITHLPQIAAKGEQHYKVYKMDAEQHTETQIKLLSADERVTEIAQILSGATVTEAALQNARELLHPTH